MMQSPKKILIVEDEKDIREAIADELLYAKFIPLEARNGNEGLATALQEHPDLILLDIVMPEMDGMAMMKKLRADTWGKTVPIILLTNLSANDKIIERVVEDEPVYYLVKSDWKIEDVVEKVTETLVTK